MKKYILLLSLLLSIVVNAQNDNHIKFMGIPLGQQLHSFIFKLKQKGLEDGANGRLSKSLKQYEMRGRFLGVSNQDIIIQYYDDKTVVGVFTSYNYKSWDEALKQYNYIKTMLTKKYGKPKKCEEKFLSNAIPKDDKGKFQAVKSDKCRYLSKYGVDSGYIEVKISNGANYLNASLIDVVLTYWDESDIKKRNPLDDL